jgi:tetratricopeptide (TPR) repeat protein
MRLNGLLGSARRHAIQAALIALILTLLGFGGYVVGVHFYVRHHLREAELAIDRYEFDEAEQQLALCLRFLPREPHLHLRMARAARLGNHFELADDHLRICQKLEGKNPENALESLLLRAQAGDIVQVERVLLEQVSLGSPDSTAILEAMAQGYNLVYHLDAARGCLNRLLKQQPENVSARLLSAALWTTAGNYEGALEDCRQAVEAQPNHRMARLRYGEALLRVGQPDEALRQFEYLRQQLGDDQPEVLMGIAHSYRELGQSETACRILDELMARNPHDSSALTERGDIALKTESPAAAEEWLRRAVADSPHDMRANFLLAQALQKQGKLEEAQRYDAARKRIEEDGKALRAAFEKVLKDPTSPEPRLEAGLICIRNGQDDEGARWLLSALEQAPNHAESRAALIELYERTGKRDLAARYRRAN